MARSLVVVESPAKAKTIQKILGKGFQVLSSMGHVKELPPQEAGVSCDKRGKPMIVRNWKEARYIACSGYPDCRFASWGKPIAATCPACGCPAMAERVRKDGTTRLSCLRKGCKGKAGPGEAGPGGEKS